MTHPAYHLDQELLHRTRRHLKPVLEATQENDRSDSPVLDDPPACVASSAAQNTPPEPSVPVHVDLADGLTATSLSRPSGGVAALDSSRLKTMVRRAIDLHGRKRMGWTSREKAAWHELVVVRGGSV